MLGVFLQLCPLVTIMAKPFDVPLTPRDVKQFHEAFYSSSSKVTQDCLILKYCSTSKPERGRSLKGGSRKGIAAKYHVKSVQGYVVQV